MSMRVRVCFCALAPADIETIYKGLYSKYVNLCAISCLSYLCTYFGCFIYFFCLNGVE